MKQTTLLEDDEIISSLLKIQDRVRYILIKHPEAKGDDVLLIWRYLRFFHYKQIKISFPEFKALLTLPAFESITRARRKLQEKDLSLRPTEKTQRKRRYRCMVMKEYYKGD
jgi:hypothetical protein